MLIFFPRWEIYFILFCFVFYFVFIYFIKKVFVTFSRENSRHSIGIISAPVHLRINNQWKPAIKLPLHLLGLSLAENVCLTLMRFECALMFWIEVVTQGWKWWVRYTFLCKKTIFRLLFHPKTSKSLLHKCFLLHLLSFLWRILRKVANFWAWQYKECFRALQHKKSSKTSSINLSAWNLILSLLANILFNIYHACAWKSFKPY